MGGWPGREADDWWDGLPVERREQIHRWVTQRRTGDDLPAEQLALDVPVSGTLASPAP